MSEWFDQAGRIERIDVADRGLQYGDGLFETVAVRNGEPRLWHRHMERLRLGLRRLDLPQLADDQIKRLFDTALRETSVDTGFCTAKLLVTAGSGPRGYRRPATVRTRSLVCVSQSAALPASHREHGVVAKSCATRLADQPLLAGLKTLNRLEQVLGRAELDDEFEGLMYDASDHVICGTMSNLFVVNGQEASTPRLRQCGIAGVARGELLQRAQENGMAVGEKDVTRRELLEAEAVLLTNSQFGAIHVSDLDGKSYARTAFSESLLTLLLGAGFPEVRP